MRNTRGWIKLDNAAKIFPPSSSKKDPKVFRFAAELVEQVDPLILQNALDKTVKKFPFYQSVLKKGLFWYYFEESNIKPIVKEEDSNPCGPLYSADYKNLLFEITYYRKRINLEIFHALSDGTGAMLFLKTLLIYYFAEKYSLNISLAHELNDYDASTEQRSADSFNKYYSKEKPESKRRIKTVYRVRGEKLPNYKLGVISGKVELKSLLEKARNYSCTIGELITAIIILSIHEVMIFREENQSIVVSVPVNFRKYFPSNTARNFFGVINIEHNFKNDGKSFEEVLRNVQNSYKKQLTYEEVKATLNRFAAIENNKAAKIVPLILKIPFLRLAHWVSERKATAAFSNIGLVTMPESIESYIRAFEVISSTRRIQVSACSYKDIISITFSTPFTSTEIEKHFFRTLTAMNIPAQVVSSKGETTEDEEI